MDINKLVERLKKLGIKIPKKTLIRWAYTEEVIDPPERHKQRGRGKTSDWSTKAVEDAAAVWAVREACRTKKVCQAQKKRLSADEIKVIKHAATRLNEGPFAVYTLPDVTGPLSAQLIAPDEIKMRFVSQDCEGLDLFRGKNRTEKVDCLNELVEKWVAAIEKVKQWEYDGINAQIMQDPHLRHLIPAEIDFSKFDPWRTVVPCPWRIDRPALVGLYWWSRPSKNGRSFYRWPFRWQRTLSESDRDKIVLYENSVDTREFFKIDVGVREGWAMAELKKIEDELAEKERTLRGLGMENTRFSTFVAMEERLETLTASEKLGLETTQKKLGLEMRRASLKNWFGV